MKITKSFIKSGYKLTEKNIVELSNRVIKENNLGKVKILLKSADNIQYEDQILRLEYLQNKKITYIEMWLFGFEKGSIYLTIKHGRNFYLSVEGPEDWVNTIYQSIEDMIINWEPQNSLTNKYFPPIVVSIFVIFLFIIAWIYIQINTILHITTTSLSEVSILLLFISIIGWSFLITITIGSEIKNLYPPIEFNFGPKHLQIEAKRRNKIYTILAVIIIPFIISLIIPHI